MATPGPAPSDYPTKNLRQRNPDDSTDYEDTTPHNIQHGNLNNAMCETQRYLTWVEQRITIAEARINAFVPIYVA